MLFLFINIAHVVKNFLLDLTLGWYLGQRDRCPSLKENHFLKKSAIDLAQMIRKREITSTQLILATIARIKEVIDVVFGFVHSQNAHIDASKLGKWIVKCGSGWPVR